jgi:hypothetical protein
LGQQPLVNGGGQIDPPILQPHQSTIALPCHRHQQFACRQVARLTWQRGADADSALCRHMPSGVFCEIARRGEAHASGQAGGQHHHLGLQVENRLGGA